MPNRTLVIPRNKWLHGEGADHSKLYRPSDGKMCCLGIYLESCGVPKSVLRNMNYPASVALDQIPEEAGWLINSEKADSGAANDLMAVNDLTTIPEENREERITDIFSANGVTVLFKDK